MGDQVAHSDLEKANLLNISFFAHALIHYTLQFPIIQVIAPGILPDEILCFVDIVTATACDAGASQVIAVALAGSRLHNCNLYSICTAYVL